MAYFDSPKNRAMWERRMTGLRQEKERRKETGYAPQQRAEKTKLGEDNPFRKKIGLARLEQIEQEQSGVRRVRRPSKTRSLEREMERGKERSAPEMNGRTR